MSVGTNENVKNVNENIQKFENGDIVKNTTVNTVSELEKTQKIVILDELLRDTENSKKEFLEDYSGQKSENENIENNEILNSENSKQFTQQQPSIQEMKSENTQNDISQENLINNSQENVINEITAPAETLKNIEEQATQTCVEVCIEECEEEQHEPQNIETPVQAVVENTANMQKQASENIITNKEKKQENSDIVKEENLEEKEKRHTQDKKDYRLERILFDRINAMQGKIKESLELIKKFERINAKEENLPNIVTTLHDKLTQEVIKQFRTVGIEFNMKSYLVQSIVSDLLNKFEEITLNILFFNTFNNFCDIIVFIKESPFFDLFSRKLLYQRTFFLYIPKLFYTIILGVYLTFYNYSKKHILIYLVEYLLHISQSSLHKNHEQLHMHCLFL